MSKTSLRVRQHEMMTCLLHHNQRINRFYFQHRTGTEITITEISLNTEDLVRFRTYGTRTQNDVLDCLKKICNSCEDVLRVPHMHYVSLVSLHLTNSRVILIAGN
jgi:hypothetical protein